MGNNTHFCWAPPQLLPRDRIIGKLFRSHSGLTRTWNIKHLCTDIEGRRMRHTLALNNYKYIVCVLSLVYGMSLVQHEFRRLLSSQHFGVSGSSQFFEKSLRTSNILQYILKYCSLEIWESKISKYIHYFLHRATAITSNPSTGWHRSWL